MKDAKRGKSAAKTRPAEPPATARLDDDADLNWRIISLLQEDGRMPFSAIAEKLGVSEGTVRNRVNLLREQNVLQITAAASPLAFGFHWNSVVFIKLNAGANLEVVAERLSSIAEVYYVVHMTGAHDLAITSFHRDAEHFREFLNRHVYGQKDIISVDANVNLKIYKMKLKWQIQPTDEA